MDSTRLSGHPLASRQNNTAVSATASHQITSQRDAVLRLHQSSARIPSGRRRERRRSRESSLSTSWSEEPCCCSCCPSCCARNFNSQICCSYFLALLSTSLVVGGVYLSIVQWNRIWLSLSLFGLVLVFFGACLYCCGTKSLSRKSSGDDDFEAFDEGFDEDCEDDGQRRLAHSKRKNRRNRPADLDQRTSARSTSQLSLNMIPQYFAPSDTGSTAPAQMHNSRSNTLMTTASTGTQNAATVPFSQIFSLNGQSFLILPIANESLEASRQRSANDCEQNIPLNSLVVKVPATGDEQMTDGPLR